MTDFLFGLVDFLLGLIAEIGELMTVLADRAGLLLWTHVENTVRDYPGRT